MAKDTYYFSHDYNARNDEKILELRVKYGAEGYGLFCTLKTRNEWKHWEEWTESAGIPEDFDASKTSSIVLSVGCRAHETEQSN
mgnify:CR=1 FL=1